MWITTQFAPSKSRTHHRAKIVRKQSTHGFVPRLEVLEDRSLLSTLTVLNNLDKGAGSLRSVIGQAHDGDVIVFDQHLAGQTITLTSGALDIKKSVDIEGPGASLLAISGNDNSRVFDISAGLTVAIAGLTITHGRAQGGGGILNVGSALTLAGDVLSYNVASNNGNSDAAGGAIRNVNGGTLTVTNSLFTNNQAIGGDSGGNAFGGGIENSSGSTANFIGCTFVGNKAVGGDGGKVTNGNPLIGLGNGGGIHNFGSLTVVNSTFTANQAIGGSGGNGGNGASFYSIDIGLGGGITNGATLVLSGSSFAYNQAIGGSNATGATSGHGNLGNGQGGGLLINVGGVATVSNTTFVDNKALGGSGNTGGSGIIEVGVGQGGGIGVVGFVSRPILNGSNLTLTGNQAVGGAGNTGNAIAGAGVGGGLANIIATTTIVDSTFTGNHAIGGQRDAGGNGADGLGGGIATLLGAVTTVMASTFDDNQAIGGAGGVGGNGGNGFGGGIYNDGRSILTVRGSTITDNQAKGGAAGSGGGAGLGKGGGLYLDVGGSAGLDEFTIDHLFGNDASTSDDDLFGDFTILS